MHRLILKNVSLALFALLLTACAGIFDSDNTPKPKPLTQYTPQIKPHLVWTARPTSGNQDEFLKLSPSVSESAIYTSSASGGIAATNKFNGHLLWKMNLKTPVTTGAGIGDHLVVVGSRYGNIYALSESTGTLIWKQSFPGEFIAKPVINNHLVILKAIDGSVYALSTQDGHAVWQFRQVEPSLILRDSSVPLVSGSHLFIGFANGNIAKLGLSNGQLYWTQPVAIPQGAFTIQRMIDIDANPISFGSRLFAATYQGKIASIEKSSGRVLWSHDISTYTGMSADNNSVFVTDAKGFVYAYGANSGLINWRQGDLEARVLSGPATMGNYIVVGDKEGFLHWLNKQDGRLAAREFAGAAIYASPIVEDNMVYVQTANGSLVAYRLS